MAATPKSRRPSRAPLPPVDRPRLEGATFVAGERRVPFRAGAVDYSRIDPSAWEAALAAVVDAGLPFVDVGVPWNRHEIGPGEVDFGERDPKKDLGRFLDLAAAAGLLVVLRPGPCIHAELTDAGVPERVLRDRRVQARSARGSTVVVCTAPRFHPAPSYASAAFHEEVGRWYDALADVVRPRLFPAGPVALLALDDALDAHASTGAYDYDYHPEAVEAYRAFLEKRYETVAALGLAHGREAPSFAAVVPPLRFDATRAAELPRHLDWARFQEELATTAVARLAERLRSAGLDVPIVASLPHGDALAPIEIPALARAADAVALDAIHGPRDHAGLRRRIALLDGNTGSAIASRVGLGGPPWQRPVGEAESLFTLLASLAYGVRGFSLHALVARDRWYGAPYDASGAATPLATTIRRLVAALDAVSFERLRREVEVALVVPPEYVRLARVTQLLGPFASALTGAFGLDPVAGCRRDDLGLSGAVQTRAWDAMRHLTSALADASIPFALVHPGAGPERLASFARIVVPTFELFDPEAWATLREASARGAHVTFGPLRPTFDLAMRERSFDAPVESTLASFETAGAAEALVASLPRATDPLVRGVEHTIHGDETGARVVFVINALESARIADVAFASTTLFDPLAEERFDGVGSIPVDAGTVRVLVVERARRSARRSTRPPPSARRKSP